MSIETWKAEFYPAPANSVKTWEEAIDQTIVKWSGLTEENLKKHECMKEGTCIRDQEYYSLQCDYRICALCQMSIDGPSEHGFVDCSICPLGILHGECEDDIDNGDIDEVDVPDLDPYTVWEELNNPKPMINALQDVKKFIKIHSLDKETKKWIKNDATE